MLGMRRLLILGCLGLAVVFSVVLVAFMPYHFYYVALESGLDSRFLKISPPTASFLSGQILSVDAVVDHNLDANTHWRSLPMGNYLIPMPLRHPYFLVIPEIDIDREKRVKIGWELQNQTLKTEVRVDLLGAQKYEYPFAENLLFRLPIFQNYLLTISAQQIWQDLFLLNLNMPSSKDESFITWVKKLWQIPYTQLAYQLFILKTRQSLFPENVINLAYDHEKMMGVLELSPEQNDSLVNDNQRREQFFLLQEGLIQRLELTTRRYSDMAQAYRSRFISRFSWKASNPDVTVGIYNEFSKLPYNRRIDQEGMTYLFAGWTHVPKQEDFLRTMIQFLERGKKNLPHLRSLYQYGYKLFGTSFSTSQENLRETEERKLERKISEELRGEINQVEGTQVVAPDGNFANEKDQVDFFLQQAKEKGSHNGDTILVE